MTERHNSVTLHSTLAETRSGTEGSKHQTAATGRDRERERRESSAEAKEEWPDLSAASRDDFGTSG